MHETDFTETKLPTDGRPGVASHSRQRSPSCASHLTMPVEFGQSDFLCQLDFPLGVKPYMVHEGWPRTFSPLASVSLFYLDSADPQLDI